ARIAVIESRLALFGRVEAVAEYAVADDQIEVALGKESIEPFEGRDDVLACAVLAGALIGIECPEVVLGEERALVVARIPLAADEQGGTHLRPLTVMAENDTLEDPAILRAHRRRKVQNVAHRSAQKRPVGEQPYRGAPLRPVALGNASIDIVIQTAARPDAGYERSSCSLAAVARRSFHAARHACAIRKKRARLTARRLGRRHGLLCGAAGSVMTRSVRIATLAAFGCLAADKLGEHAVAFVNQRELALVEFLEEL